MGKSQNTLIQTITMHKTQFSGHCRYIVTDVDGTFISSDRQLIQENLDAIGQAREAGIKFAFATGRYWRSMHPLAARLALKAPQIHDNGATLFDQFNEKVLDCVRIPENTVRFFYNGLRAAGFTPTLCTPMDYFYAPPAGETVQGLIDHDEFPIEMESDDVLLDTLASDAVKVAAFSTSDIPHLEKTLAELTREASSLRMRFNTVFTEPGIAAVNMENVNKLTGVDMACKLMGISREDVAAIGDGDNDVDMIEGCGIGIAVANAAARAKSAASHIVGTNDECGFAQAIRMILAGKL